MNLVSLILATAHEAPPFEILGDVPLTPPPGSPHWVQYFIALLTALGALIPLASGVAAFLNRYEAALLERGEKPSPFLDALVAGVNRVALNSNRMRPAEAAKAPEVKP